MGVESLRGIVSVHAWYATSACCWCGRHDELSWQRDRRSSVWNERRAGCELEYEYERDFGCYHGRWWK
jgi:hypothetical protein